ncbi:LEAF RUST 10 DISEASE-RESISTANCE LOCUS RECEPTOR-LIKE PROTEIN KINASE-like 2.7 [Syzygium oleosum]|uniref:LEAF RUST 10 DISEASE-RESISTANCE LOCUS RECEPTOR-LIKE PROTEIN KINASE-like 2.7 n=1 Tax=Syzygium oleosum TaxID=219896 RepID=UPI0024B8CB6C|nr:LEAF RUST 10 DISEASE-RESISTANCE LOCUS RECEPTOR-LIKE PROTEIN KINASE-like 2.7 [Syzygium oleosum]
MHKDQLLVLLLLLLLQPWSFSIAVENSQCTTSCGEVVNISSPFRLRGDPKICGDPMYELACVNNCTTIDLNSGKYYVRYIDYTNYTIRVADVGLRKGNCSSLPLHSSSCFYSNDQDNFHPFSCQIYGSTISIMNCTKAVDSQLYINASSCFDGVAFSNFSSTRRRLYAMVDVNVSSVETTCTIQLTAIIPRLVGGNHLRTYAQIHKHMVYGFELSWLEKACKMQFKDCHLCDINAKQHIYCVVKSDDIVTYLSYIVQSIEMIPSYGIGLICDKLNLSCRIRINVYLLHAMLFLLGIVFPCMVVKFILGAPCVMILLIRKWRRRHLAMDQNVEEFLQSNNNFLPIRYSYSDIKKITRGLKDKLGEGGYGSVFKGRLRSGREVAVKILKKGKANGQDFISEVATIGRIHHVNVVGLIGFCFEGSKQALVYNFMQNGSLDKHIFSRGQGTSLDCKEVYEIALGVARGIEYLHRGCDVQILHFDIKPHNILLDMDFTPKVSDFGLARLYPTNQNSVSITAARGTLGYMAPELVYKNLGGISYKADVYSFGKLLIEMASGRKNWDEVVECSSQKYFPLWVHDQVSEGLDVPVKEASEEDRRIIKKMIIVALWCIQLNPSERPSMHKVLEMLEREVDDLQIPPKPLFYPAEVSTTDDGTWIDNGYDTISTSSTSAITYVDSQEHISTSITQA